LARGIDAKKKGVTKVARKQGLGVIVDVNKTYTKS
jgi:hypothetical protein